MQASAPSRRRSRARELGLLPVLVLLLGLLLPRFASAAGPESRPVIAPGREAEILALFEPYAIGDELSPGWTLHSFRVEMGTIAVFVVEDTPENDTHENNARLTLDHPQYGPAGAREIRGFALHLAEQPAGSEAALAALSTAIEANDDGSFWGGEVIYAEEARSYPIETLRDSVTSLDNWLLDGLVVYAFLTLLLLALALHKLRGAPRWILLSLAAIVVGAGLLRWLLSPEVALAPWPYTRALISGARAFYGPALALLHPEPLWLSEIVLDSTFAYALLAPLAVYVHARYLLDDQRAALLAALIVAVLPLHLRFSHSDAAFIPSITVSSTCFALIHAATREQRSALGWLALLALGPLLALMYSVRPLNLMYFPLLVATGCVHQGFDSDKPPLARARALAALLLVCAVTFGLGLPRLLTEFNDQVHEGLSLETLRSALEVLFNPRFNALLNPVFMPPGLVLLAAYGARALWVRGRRPLLYFILAWLLGFLAAHAYVVPISPYMQARYHLHLVVPFMLLCACGAEAGLRWLAEPARECPRWLAWTRGRERLITYSGLAYLLASPLLHLHAVRYAEFNDTREWNFVHSLRDSIPRECTVLEYTGRGADMRFRRVGTYSERGVAQKLWEVVEIPMHSEGEHELPEPIRALLEDPPPCFYWYEGLPCYGNKPPELYKAPACDAIEGWVELEEVAALEIDSVPYDGNLAFDLGEVDNFTLRLFRARARE